jgi:hypothetical protein
MPSQHRPLRLAVRTPVTGLGTAALTRIGRTSAATAARTAAPAKPSATQLLAPAAPLPAGRLPLRPDWPTSIPNEGAMAVAPACMTISPSTEPTPPAAH